MAQLIKLSVADLVKTIYQYVLYYIIAIYNIIAWILSQIYLPMGASSFQKESSKV